MCDRCRVKIETQMEDTDVQMEDTDRRYKTDRIKSWTFNFPQLTHSVTDTTNLKSDMNICLGFTVM